MSFPSSNMEKQSAMQMFCRALLELRPSVPKVVCWNPTWIQLFFLRIHLCPQLWTEIIMTKLVANIMHSCAYNSRGSKSYIHVHVYMCTCVHVCWVVDIHKIEISTKVISLSIIIIEISKLWSRVRHKMFLMCSTVFLLAIDIPMVCSY